MYPSWPTSPRQRRPRASTSARRLRAGRRVRLARLCRVGRRFGLCRSLGLDGLPCLGNGPALERVEELRVRGGQGTQRRGGKRGRDYQGKDPCKSDRCAVSFHGWLPFVQTGAAIQCHCIGPSSQSPIPLGHSHRPGWHLMSHSDTTVAAWTTAAIRPSAAACTTHATAGTHTMVPACAAPPHARKQPQQETRLPTHERARNRPS